MIKDFNVASKMEIELSTTTTNSWQLSDKKKRHHAYSHD
jgi:hypothetical protein